MVSRMGRRENVEESLMTFDEIPSIEKDIKFPCWELEIIWGKRHDERKICGHLNFYVLLFLYKLFIEFDLILKMAWFEFFFSILKFLKTFHNSKVFYETFNI